MYTMISRNAGSTTIEVLMLMSRKSREAEALNCAAFARSPFCGRA